MLRNLKTSASTITCLRRALRRSEEVEDDGEQFEDKMKRLAASLHHQTAEAAKLDAAIAANLKELGYGE